MKKRTGIILLGILLLQFGAISCNFAQEDKKKAEIRKMIPESLYQYDPGNPKEFEILVNYLNDPDDNRYRSIAASVLGRKKQKKAIPYLIQALNDPDKNVKMKAAESLLNCGEKNLAYNEIEQLIKSGDTEPLNSLFIIKNEHLEIRDKKAERLATKALSSKNDEIKLKAAQLYINSGQINKNILETLSNIVNNSENEKARISAINVLAESKDKEAIRILENSNAKNASIKKEIRKALNKMKDSNNNYETK